MSPILKKLILILLPAIVLLACNSNHPEKQAWTPGYEQKVYKEISFSVRNRFTDSSEKQKFVSYMVSRLKQELPGGLESVPPDSLYRISQKTGSEYGHPHSGEVTK